MNLFLWIALGLLVVIGPLASSAVICAPKWYREKVAPSRAGERLRVVGGVLRKDIAPPVPGWMKRAGEWVLLALFSPVLLLVVWVDAWRVLISRVCPYSTTVDDGPVLSLYRSVRGWWGKRHQKETYREAP